jgi:hypothetical protein
LPVSNASRPRTTCQVHGQDEERPQQDELLHHQGREARPQLFDPQERAVEQGVAAFALAPLLPHGESGEAGQAGEDEEGNDREAERHYFLAADGQRSERLDPTPLAALQDSEHGEPQPERRQGDTHHVEAGSGGGPRGPP